MEPKALEMDLKIVNDLGLHTRAATVLVKLAKSFQSSVEVSAEGVTANGKSIMGLLALGARDAASRRLEVGLHALARVRDTPPQSALGEAARRSNVRGAFAVTRPAEVAGRDVLLVDDVLTTGATASACAEVLRAAGALSVAVLTLARAVP